MSSRLNGFRVWGRVFQLPAAAERAARIDGPWAHHSVAESVRVLNTRSEVRGRESFFDEAMRMGVQRPAS